ncbi:class I SAM-dependent methyltransferase [Qipengyuania sp. DY56-A-20]|jgi:ubiquinone/menaquinone biosynthesis C-methylase UbiE|uniref:Class I SAM-dependent methyltransferase n=1 Tax=Qipengyuania benthica TaxID=3067651 RepID=A0ABT9H847_9SPHN|nr:class I SAM-dependent methyltransferase [Qipengyuania sp. DY56-A-20]MBU1253966.1 class I SAM-dependent methyltransferase [Alphaproteobacteria bacterium]MDP4539492.1 class I SAM-dependent methyltransferase [Qipengyuania sp. DY56-A-20]
MIVFRPPLLLLASAAVLAATGCEKVDTTRPETALDFPLPDRPVSDLGGNEFSTETARDNRGEAETVMELAGIEKGMTVADIGAGEGYYTVRLAERVGEDGRVLAQDIDRAALQRLGQRVERERLDNVAIKPGAADDPHLPENSFDRIFMVHMYHEISEPYALLWRMWPSLREGGQVVVVDVDRPTDQHGIAPMLLACEFERAGYRLVAFRDAPQLAGYYAQFERAANRPEPDEIRPCRDTPTEAETASR